jgi:hypothetical protein
MKHFVDADRVLASVRCSERILAYIDRNRACYNDKGGQHSASRAVHQPSRDTEGFRRFHQACVAGFDWSGERGTEKNPPGLHELCSMCWSHMY